MFSAMHPIRLDVFEDTLYVALYDQTIERLNKYNGSHSKIILAAYTRTSDLVVLHPLKQVYNGKCLYPKIIFQYVSIYIFSIKQHTLVPRTAATPAVYVFFPQNRMALPANAQTA